MKASTRLRTAATVASRDFGPNMTPMVDVVMVILIFFMAGSAILGPEWFLGARVEEAQTAPRGDRPGEPPEDDPFALDLPPTRVRVTLASVNGATRVEGLNLSNATLDDLAARLRDLRDTGVTPTLEIVVAPSSDTAYQDVIRAYELCAQSGARSASLARSTP